MKNIELMRKDYIGAKVYEIGESKETGDTHFIFKKGKKIFGISVKVFENFDYIEKTKGIKNEYHRI